MSQGPFARVLRTYGTGGRSPYSLLKSPRLPLCPHPDYKAVARSKATAEAGEKRRSEEHTSELQSRPHLVCRLLLEKKKTKKFFIWFRMYLSGTLLLKLSSHD